MSKVVTIGLVGGGAAAAAQARAMAAGENCRLVACADAERSRAEALAREFGIPAVFASLDELLAGAHIQLLLLTTPPADHLAQVETACRAGVKAILCEAPLAVSGDDGERMLGVAREHGVLVMEGAAFRHHPQLQMARALAATRVGHVTRLRAHCFRPATLPAAAGAGAAALAGRVLLDQGYCLVNLLNFLAGAPPAEVACQAAGAGNDGAVTISGRISYDQGLVAEFTAAADHTPQEQAEIAGAQGSVVIPRALLLTGQEPTVELYGAGPRQGPPLERFPFPPLDLCRLQVEGLCRCLLGGGFPAVPLEESILNLHTLSALHRSLDSGRQEALGLSLERKHELARPRH